MRGIFSLQKPLGNTESFTLEDILASPELPADDAEYRRNGKPAGRSIKLDAETITLLRSRFGNLPLGRAVRGLVGLPALEMQDAWQKWEDDVIKDCYPWGGSIAVIAQGVERSRNAVINRAGLLGVKKGVFKPDPDWFTLHEVANVFHVDFTLVHKWCKLGYLQSIKLRAPLKRFMFVESQAIIDFIRNHPFVYPHERLVNDYRKYLPSVLHEWVRTDKAGKILNYSKSGINNYIDRGHIPVRIGFGRQRYIKLDDLRRYLENPPPRRKQLKPEEWKVIYYGERKHYITPNINGCWYLVCRSHSYRPAYDPEWKARFGYRMRLARGKATCKMCLQRLNKLTEKSGNIFQNINLKGR